MALERELLSCANHGAKSGVQEHLQKISRGIDVSAFVEQAMCVAVMRHSFNVSTSAKLHYPLELDCEVSKY